MYRKGTRRLIFKLHTLIRKRLVMRIYDEKIIIRSHKQLSIK